MSPRGDMRFSVIEERMNSEKFIEFLKKLHQDAGKPVIVMADNASYHNSKRVQQFAQDNDNAIHLGHLPKYAPELNPDEQAWEHAKARLAKLFMESAGTMRRRVLGIMRSIQKQTSLVRSFLKLEGTIYASI
ncbi:MAG: transposase [Chthoniobacteraceae bacterium]|nr:transposase [Chthoniobacteraceae bacterium]